MNRALRYGLVLFGIIALIDIVIFTIFESISYAYLSPGLVTRLIMLVLASIVASAIITFLLMSTTPVLKNYLNTFRQLLRLDTLSHPLLLKLQHAAPSTFQHSMQVANLGHRAAKAIGADAFLTRLGGYYHDIGKIKNADFFIENRRDHENQKTENLTPLDTVKTIHEHVAEGVSLAKEYNLPEEVVAFIPEHHGTIIAASMYEAAKNQGMNVNKKDFRYPGPRPMSKETAIIMLADAIESKIRTLPEFTLDAMTEVVDSIIKERQDDKQLELSGLTQTDLKAIRKAFIEGVQILHHRRIKYPGDEKQATVDK